MEDEQMGARIMGVPITVKGVNMGLLVALVGVMIFSGYLLMVRSTAEHESIAVSVQKQTEAMKEQTSELTRQGERQAKAAEEQNFMLFYATEEQKKKIRDAKKIPESLREILR